MLLMQFIQLNELNLSKYDDHYLKLKLIFERTIELIDTHNPDEIAIEAPFFGKNVQSMLKLGRAQGVAMAAGLSREIPVTEYEPKKIKMAIKYIAHKNIQMIPEWKQVNPEYKCDDGKINDKYLKIIMQSMGGSDHNEDTLFQEKIISKLAKEVTIEK